MLGGMTETEAKWAGRVLEWRESGKGAEEFAEGRGFEASTLRFWASRLKNKKAESTERTPVVRMARVVRAAPPAQSTAGDACIVVEVGQVRVAVRRGFDVSVLREIIAALQDAR